MLLKVLPLAALIVFATIFSASGATVLETCSTSVCPDRAAVCRDMAAGMNCTECKPGYTSTRVASSTEDFRVCMQDRDVCGQYPDHPMSSASRTCVDSRGCRRGYSFNEVTRKCQDIDECAVNHGGCVAPAACFNLPGSSHCVCPEPELYEYKMHNGTMACLAKGVTPPRPYVNAADPCATYFTGGAFDIQDATETTEFNTTSTFNVSGCGLAAVNGVVLRLAFEHTYLEDLYIRLRAPDGREACIMKFNGGSINAEGAAYTFRDSANQTISRTPCGPSSIGCVLPVVDYRAACYNTDADNQVLTTTDLAAVFRGASPNGAWTLVLSDMTEDDTGRVIAWTVSLM